MCGRLRRPSRILRAISIVPPKECKESSHLNRVLGSSRNGPHRLTLRDSIRHLDCFDRVTKIDNIQELPLNHALIGLFSQNPELVRAGQSTWLLASLTTKIEFSKRRRKKTSELLVSRHSRPAQDQLPSPSAVSASWCGLSLVLVTITDPFSSPADQSRKSDTQTPEGKF